MPHCGDGSYSRCFWSEGNEKGKGQLFEKAPLDPRKAMPKRTCVLENEKDTAETVSFIFSSKNGILKGRVP
jgi:hypothetical protein